MVLQNDDGRSSTEQDQEDRLKLPSPTSTTADVVMTCAEGGKTTIMNDDSPSNGLTTTANATDTKMEDVASTSAGDSLPQIQSEVLTSSNAAVEAAPVKAKTDFSSPTNAAAATSTTNTTLDIKKTEGSSSLVGVSTIVQFSENDCDGVDQRKKRGLNKPPPDSSNEASSSPTKKKQKKYSNTKEEFDDMEWICGECHEAECLLEPSADFLLCDGNCKRVFHHPCVGLSKLPDSDTEWLCKDCTTKRHQCAFCHEYGDDDIDVFKCRKVRCGLYFHESCLAMNNVDIVFRQEIKTATTDEASNTTSNEEKTDENDENGDVDMGSSETSNNNNDVATATDTTSALSSIPVFTCPAHNCWTCTQKDLLQAEKKVEEEKAKNSNTKRKKKGKKKKAQSVYQCKSETRLFRCLYCPWAYHSTCIPPTSRFHELAVLCHEHAATHKLPELDVSTSYQGAVEDQIDQQMLKLAGQNRRKRAKLRKGKNPFFPGLRGDRLETQEKYLLEFVAKKENNTSTSDDANRDDTGDQTEGSDAKPKVILPKYQDYSFCLPCDVKNEVHSKPASYRFTQTLKYDPNNKPKKIPPSGDQCQCVGSCGDDCFNRVLLIECYGDGSKNSNCKVGEKCGNRSLGKRQLAKCKPQREGGRGWGLVALEAIPKGRLVQEYTGEVIDEKEKERRLVDWNKEHPNDPNFYIMSLSGGWYIDARDCANMSRFINHSCDPNCSLITVNVKGYKRNGIYSKRDIAAGEFLSYDYRFDTKQGDRFVCHCGAAKCRGTMKGENGNDNQGMKKPANWKEAKARYDQDKKFMEDRKTQCVISQVDALVPAAEQPDEYVMNGPPEKHRDTAVRNGIFLWRNTKLGADFVSRNSRLEASSKSMSKPTPKRKPFTNTDLATSSSGEMDILSVLRKNHSN